MSHRAEEESETAETDGEVSESPDGLPAADAFALLGNDTRIEILHALLEAGADESPVAFSTLYDRVDIDDSAHFNYHLKQLTDHFVRRTDDGYEFRYPGWKVVRSVLAGTFTDRASLDPFDAPGTCYDCNGDLQAWYGDDRLTIACEDCGTTHVCYTFPPGGLDDRTREEFLLAFHHHVRHHYCLAADGVCPECMGRMETTLHRNDDRFPGVDFRVEHACDRCQNRIQSAVGLNLLDTAEVLTFHAERGVDLTTEPFWTSDWCVSDEHTTVVSEDPLELRLDIPCDGDTLSVVVDETLSVLDVSRSC
jgi:hypothetical protein